MRKFKVSTRITSYIWAESPEDACKYHLELLRKEKLTLAKNGVTVTKISRALGVPFLEAPEDISKTRDPIIKPRPLDWIEIAQDGMCVVALVTRLSKRKVYYYEALTQSHRSIDREAWGRWAKKHKIHPAYEEALPPFIIHEAIREHENRGLITASGGTPESSIILAVLEKYGYEPDDYELQNGFWAENLLDREITRYLIENDRSGESAAATNGSSDAVDEWDIQLGSDVPTIDDLNATAQKS